MKSWEKMQKAEARVYICGGYVRDRLMGIKAKDHDFVVVGATPDIMLTWGLTQVGADFPVYHNENGDEFALARTERKNGRGYNGFEVDFDPSITLEQDLFRRDLTINSLAREVIGWNELGHAKLSDDIIDPFGGTEDLANKVLRPVSEHFKDDPVRVLRAGRFAARFPDFQWHRDLLVACDQLMAVHELEHLVPERVFAELEKNMTEPRPDRLFELLHRIGHAPSNGTSAVFPGSGLFVTTDMVNQLASLQHLDVDVRKVARFAVLTHRLSPPQCNMFLNAIKAPTQIRRVCLNTIAVMADCVRDPSPLNGPRLMGILEGLDALRSGQHDIPVMVEVLSVMNNANAQSVARVLQRAVTEVKAIGMQDVGGMSVSGAEIAGRIRSVRVAKLGAILCE